MMQKSIKVLATSVILTTALITPIMTSSLNVHAETVTTQTTRSQISAERVFNVPGKGDAVTLSSKDRRSASFSVNEPTGLYASPNEQIKIYVDGKTKIKASIGTYNHNGGDVQKFTLVPGENTISSQNGGMIYLVNTQNGGSIKAEIKTGGTPVPFFELGKNTKQDLINMLEQYPGAPTVELKGERSLVTASPERVKQYLIGSNTDPTELLKKIDEVVRIEDRVSGITEEQADKHYVHLIEGDASSQYMFATEYRTVYVQDAIKKVLDLNAFTTEGWGPWHEMGHQRQQSPWKWTGLAEVTVNIYSMNVQREFGHPSELETRGSYPKAAAYLAKPQAQKDFNAISDNFTKLVMFWQLQLSFGDDFYPQLHQLYRSMPNGELPKTDDEKIQGFIINTSKVAKQNLLPFFDKWGLKATDETRQKVEGLNLQLLTAPIWEATDSKPVIVEGK